MNEVALSSASLMPQTYEGKLQMAGALAKSGLIPTGLNTPEKVFVALQWGHELGLSPMVAVNNVAVINGKPTLSADIMAAVVKRSPEYGGIKWIEMSETRAECEITRILPNGEKEVQKSSFSMQDAQNAGLAGRDNWKKYPKRMLKHRCLSYGLKDMFPDILAGLYTPEEMESVSDEPKEEPKERNITPEVKVEVKAETTKPTNDDRQKLGEIIDKYEKQMNVNNKYGNPYEMACKAMADNDPEQIKTMLKRCTDYLGRKGIQVA